MNRVYITKRFTASFFQPINFPGALKTIIYGAMESNFLIKNTSTAPCEECIQGDQHSTQLSVPKTAGLPTGAARSLALLPPSPRWRDI